MAIHSLPWERDYGIESASKNISNSLSSIYRMYIYSTDITDTARIVRPVNNTYTNPAIAVTTTAVNAEYIKFTSDQAADATAGTGAVNIRIWAICGACRLVGYQVEKGH